MRLLVLGGTRFVGRWIAAEAQRRGHRVTVFHRGRHAPPPGVEAIRGDRRRPDDLDHLRRERWDAAVDSSGYTYPEVHAAVTTLRERTDRYVFVSTILVHRRPLPPGADEHAPLLPPDYGGGDVTAERYGPCKVAAEEAVRMGFGDRALVVRPGILVGPWDYSGRFTYWCLRVARGGDVLAPGAPERPVQLLDARDLAAFVVDALERNLAGTFHAVGPQEPLTFGALLERLRATFGSRARFLWVGDDVLRAAGVAPFGYELPFWVPAEEAGLFQIDGRRAWDAGLRCRPLEETARDTLDWARAHPEGTERHAGLSSAREAALLRAAGYRSEPSVEG